MEERFLAEQAEARAAAAAAAAAEEGSQKLNKKQRALLEKEANQVGPSGQIQSSKPIPCDHPQITSYAKGVGSHCL